MNSGDLGWVFFIAIGCFVLGVLAQTGYGERAMQQSARAGVMVIDGTAYVMLPAKRGE